MATAPITIEPAGLTNRWRRARRRTGRRVLMHIGLIAGALIMAYPLLWMVGSSFKSNDTIFGTANPIPNNLSPRNFLQGWVAPSPTFTTFYINSLTIAIFAVAGNVIACTLTAYAFARLDFKLKRVWFAVMLGSIMLPTHALLIPQYVIFYHLGWINTFLPLFVPKFLATDAFFIFLMVQFIRGIPRSLDEAAMLDGCGRIRIFFRILVPLMLPVLITTMIFTFIWTYNDFFSQLIYLNAPSAQTVPVALRAFVDATGQSSYGQLLAMSVLSLIPTFIVFLVAQKRIVEGISTTGLRG